MTEEVRYEPEPGTIGVGVSDGAAGDVSSADEISKSIAEYFRRSGVATTELELRGLGSTTGAFMESVVQNFWASLALHFLTMFLAFIRGTRDRKFDREQKQQLRPCFIHLWDHRGERNNAIEALRLLPGLDSRLNEEFPNRNYTYFIQSSLPKQQLRQVHIKLENYDDLGLTARAIMKRLNKLSESEFVFVSLKDGPYHTRPYTLDAV